MTGLNPEVNDIIEIGTVVTDQELNVIAAGPAFVIHQSEESLGKMDAWCVDQHGKSGLTAKVRASRVTLEQAEKETLAFLKVHCKPRESPLCGNSIWQDRRFLMKYMPVLEKYFHYRNVDVSSIKELVVRWYPNIKIPKKSKTHQVIKDIEESIEELRFYRKTLFI